MIGLKQVFVKASLAEAEREEGLFPFRILFLAWVGSSVVWLGK